MEALSELPKADLPSPIATIAKTDSRPKQVGSVSIPHNLPTQTTHFFGRSTELAYLERFLTEPNKRLVTVVGPGGMGKTRLALAAAEAFLRRSDSGQVFADGIFFVPLASVASADSLAATIAESLNFQFGSSDEPHVQLLRYLRARRKLIIFDNFEHLLDGVHVVQAIIDECPEVALLVTSREKLSLYIEQILPVSGLTFPPNEISIEPEQIAQYSAVQLFVERARSIRPSFELNTETLGTVTNICHQLDGMPLALVLAAAWIDILTVTEISREIGRDLDFLETELSDVPTRQRSLRAAFHYSWRRLADQEKKIFSQLSVFRGGFSTEAAASVADASLRDIQKLASKSLLTSSHSSGQSGARYSVHELLRQFAEEELSHSPRLQVAAKQRHSAYYLILLRRSYPQLRTERQLELLDTITRDSDNIAAAWHNASAGGEWENLAGAIDSWGLYHLWLGLHRDGYKMCAALSARLKSTVESSFIQTKLLIKALAWHGIFLSATEDALSKLEDSLAILDQQEEDSPEIHRLKSFVLRQMAWRLIPVAKQKARFLVEQALQFSLQLGDDWQVAESHYFLGLIYWQLGKISESRKSTEYALAMFSKSGDQRMQVLANIILAWVIQTEGDFASAVRLRYKTLDLCRRIGDRPIIIHCMSDLAMTLLYLGEFDEGLQYAERCVALSVEYGFHDKEGFARSTLSHLLMHLGHYDRARSEIERALELVKETGHQDVESGVWSVLGDLALVQGNSGREAQVFFEKGLMIGEQIQAEVFLGVKLRGLLLGACQDDDEAGAKQYAVTYLEHVIRIRHHGHLIEALASISLYLVYHANKKKALAIWRKVSDEPYINASIWYGDVIGRNIEVQTANLSPQPTSIAPDHSLWQTAELLVADLK